MRIAPLTRDEMRTTLSEVARLRIEVFRDWPYLYDGDPAYEEIYLSPYRDSDSAIIVGAWDEGRLVGASTGSPLGEHANEFAAAFAETGLDLSEVFYCAESVLLPEWRGHGIGHRFFEEREAHARKLGYTRCCFCSVQRPDDHPARPREYRPLDGFWRKRGYEKLPGVVAEFSWKDVDCATETAKPLQFWMRNL